MNFGRNKTPIEVIKEGSFGGTCFRNIYSNVNDKWYKNSWKELDLLTRFCLGLFMNVKWLGGRGKYYPPPPTFP